MFMKRIVWLFVLAGWAALWAAPLQLRAQEGWVIAPKPADEKMNHWVDSVMDGLSLQEQMGQLLMVTFPTRADKAARKHLRTLVKKYKIGGLVFAEGSAEEQAMLTNLAQKDARVPLLMAVDGGSALDTGRKGQPRFPDCNALECITDDRLLEEYGTEIGRELRLLGVHAQLASVPASLEAYVRGLAGEGVLSVPSDLRLLADSLVPSAVLHSGAADYLEAGSDMVCLELDAQEAIASLHAALKSGRLTKEAAAEAGCGMRAVVCASHDTASAVLAAPIASDRSAPYLSSGTWSLLGIEQCSAHTDEGSLADNFSNEGGAGGVFRWQKNIMGLWMLQSVRKELGLGFAEAEQLARENPCDALVDCEDGAFLAPPSMSAAIREQAGALTDGELLHCIYKSLAHCYKGALDAMGAKLGKTFTTLNIIGGTFKNNTAVDNGGAIYAQKADSVIIDSVFDNNKAEIGSAITLNNSNMTIMNSTFTNHNDVIEGAGSWIQDGVIANGKNTNF